MKPATNMWNALAPAPAPAPAPAKALAKAPAGDKGIVRVKGNEEQVFAYCAARGVTLTSEEKVHLRRMWKLLDKANMQPKPRGAPKKAAHDQKWTVLELAWLWRDVTTAMKRDDCGQEEAIAAVQKNWSRKRVGHKRVSASTLRRRFNEAKNSPLVLKAGKVIEKLDDT